jgi:Tfp pilus assembly protein FimT
MRKNSGFSLIELVMIIGMIAIIAGFGVPSLLNYRQKAQLGKASRDLYAGLQRTKMEATRNNRFCVFNFSPATVNGTTYQFHIFVDESEPRNFVYDEGVDTFVTGFRSTNYPGVQVDNDFGGGSGITFPTDTGTPAIAFAPDGLPKKLNGTLSSGSIYFNDGGENGRQISVSLAGNIQITQYKAN